MHSIMANFKYFTFPIFIINSNNKKTLNLSVWSDIIHQAANLSSPNWLPKAHVLLGAVTGWSLAFEFFWCVCLCVCVRLLAEAPHAGMELLFKIGSRMLWFRLVTKAMLKHISVLAIAEQDVHSTTVFASHSSPVSRMGWVRAWEGSEPADDLN